MRWYLDNEAWWRPIREKVYDGRRLGLVKLMFIRRPIPDIIVIDPRSAIRKRAQV